MQNRIQHSQILYSILALALALRLFVALSHDPLALYYSGGGDTSWYLANGLAYFTGAETGMAHGIRFSTTAITVPPVYFIFTGLLQNIFSFSGAIIAIWVVQAIAGTLVCLFAHDLVFALKEDNRAALFAAGTLAISPVMIQEASFIMTESLYIFFIMAGIWLYVCYAMQAHKRLDWSIVVLSGAVFGIATLTRAVALLFPLGLAGHAVIYHGRIHWQRGSLIAMLLLSAHVAIVSTWTIRNLRVSNRFVIASTEFFPAVWRGAVENDGSPGENDALLGEQSAAEQASVIITREPLSYLQRRVEELLTAYLQPHGTIGLGGESLKALTHDWARSGFSAAGLWRLINGEGFWIKLLFYIWHYLGLIGGLFGMWLVRNNWRVALVPIGFILYTTLLHLVVLALPRYIFPTYPFYWIFASVAWVWLWDKLRVRVSQRDAKATIFEDQQIAA